MTNHAYKVGDTVEIVMSAIPEMVGLHGQITGFSNGRVMVRISSKNCRQYGHDFLFPRERIKPVATQASATTKVNEEEYFSRLRAFFFPTEKPKCLHCGSTTVEKGFNRDSCATVGCKNYSAQFHSKAIQDRIKRLKEAIGGQ